MKNKNRNAMASLLAMSLFSGMPGPPGRKPSRMSTNPCLNCLDSRPNGEPHGMFCTEECKAEFRALDKYGQDRKLEKYNRNKRKRR